MDITFYLLSLFCPSQCPLKRSIWPGNKTHIFQGTGCIPVPKNKDGKRIIEGWHFFYNGWNPLTIYYDDDDILFCKATNSYKTNYKTTDDEDQKIERKETKK